MRLQSLKPAQGSTKNRKRIARGQGSGKGGTATRGHKGAQSRSGYSKKVGFEGGQMPLQRRVPKFGFKNNNKVVMKPINLDDLQALSEAKKLTEITPEVLRENGMIGKGDVVKVLGRGELKAKLTVKAHKFSKTAQEAIEKAGGSASVEE
ncbi:50S ribosomal protein L15 [Marinoscillum furvescens]|uniref:Large ribosomal subunit protein uL15 n=1 Tax=Marinoscillum furvescens DSM 4134 TaxID=1122208 RepID=A0A3D9L2W0_MARFU|nr:50S ribosomal protein L15 [Marinoscillum furvescens]RED99477.1 LSU ribosomal protein L15P [Marinoscillum furvescens DSM 4134]